MNAATIRRFLILLSSECEAKRVGLYQLVREAEYHHSLRNIQKQKEIGEILETFPYPFVQIGKYFQAIFFYRQGQAEKATSFFENVAETGPKQYRAKALSALGGVEQARGDLISSLRFRVQACSIADPATFLEAQSGIAVIKSIEGDHRGATKHLEKLMPLARALGPGITSFKYLNSLAVELAEVGRVREASNISQIVLASPYASVYPELYETGQEIAVKSYHASRSRVFLPQLTPQNILTLPERNEVATVQSQPARVIHFQDWKSRMVKEPEGKEDVDAMDDKQLLLKIIEVISDESLTENELRQILKLALRLTSKRA